MNDRSAADAHVAVWPSFVTTFAAAVGLVFVTRRDVTVDVRTTDWLANLARAGARRSLWRASGAIVAVQSLVLRAMESLERVLATGHVDGGFGRLGAPLPLAIPLARVGRGRLPIQRRHSCRRHP